MQTHDLLRFIIPTAAVFTSFFFFSICEVKYSPFSVHLLHFLFLIVMFNQYHTIPDGMGGVAVHMALWVTFTLVNAPLLLNNIFRFWSGMLPSGRCPFQGRSSLFQGDNAKPHSERMTTARLRSKSLGA